MSNPATDRQVKFAHAIADALGVQYPEEETRQSLFIFIRDNREKFDKLMLPKRCRRMEAEALDGDRDVEIADALGIDIYTGCLGD